MVCQSGILMAALTASIIVADVWFWRSSRVITHLFLGGIATTLFVFICQRGYELVNWAFLALIVVFLLVSKLYVSPQTTVYTQSSECSTCGIPASSCSCVAPPIQIPTSNPVITPAPSCTQSVSMNNYNVEDPTESTKRWYHMKTNL